MTFNHFYNYNAWHRQLSCYHVDVFIKQHVNVLLNSHTFCWREKIMIYPSDLTPEMETFHQELEKRIKAEQFEPLKNTIRKELQGLYNLIISEPEMPYYHNSTANNKLPVMEKLTYLGHQLGADRLNSYFNDHRNDLPSADRIPEIVWYTLMSGRFSFIELNQEVSNAMKLTRDQQKELVPCIARICDNMHFLIDSGYYWFISTTIPSLPDRIRNIDNLQDIPENLENRITGHIKNILSLTGAPSEDDIKKIAAEILSFFNSNIEKVIRDLMKAPESSREEPSSGEQRINEMFDTLAHSIIWRFIEIKDRESSSVSLKANHLQLLHGFYTRLVHECMAISDITRNAVCHTLEEA